MNIRLDDHEKAMLDRKRVIDVLGELIQSLQRRLADAENERDALRNCLDAALKAEPFWQAKARAALE